MNNKTCVGCSYLGRAKETGLCEKRNICLYPEELPACSKFEPKVITNGDRIRQVSNGVLSFLMTRLMLDGCPIDKNKPFNGCKISNDCTNCLRVWLNSPAKEESEVDNG